MRSPLATPSHTHIFKRPRSPAQRPPAFTLIETLVVVVILLVVTAISIPAISRARASSRAARCLSNLNSIGTAFNLYAEMNNGILPDPGQAGTQWEDILTPSGNRNIYQCPGDTELFDAIGSSYDWRDTGDPATTLAGLEITPMIRQDAVLAFDSLPGWHTKGNMNAVLVDGSAQSMQQETCLNDLLKSVKR